MSGDEFHLYLEPSFKRGPTAASAFRRPRSRAFFNAASHSQTDSISPAGVLNALKSRHVEATLAPTALKSTDYTEEFTQTDDENLKAFRVPAGTVLGVGGVGGPGLVFNGRYVVEKVLSTDGLTSVVLKARDKFYACGVSKSCGFDSCDGGGEEVKSEGGEERGRECGGRGGVKTPSPEPCGCRRVALKVLHGAYAEVGRHEIRMLRSLCASDRNSLSGICRILDDFTFGPHVCIVLEFVSGFESVDLERKRFSLLRRDSSRLSSRRVIDDIRAIAFKLVVSLGFFRWTNVIHGDLKPENILISTRNSSDHCDFKRTESGPISPPAIDAVKILDFGNAFFDTFSEASLFYDDFQLQSPLYRAPEVFFGVAGFDAGIDVWSLGAVLAEFFLGKPLFDAESEAPDEILGAVVSILGPLPKQFLRKGKFYERRRRFCEGAPERRGDVVERLCNVMETRDRIFVDFVARCLTPNPAKRPTPAQLAVHPFLAPVCPVAFLREPEEEIAGGGGGGKSGRSSEDEIPYRNADFPSDYYLKPMRPAETGRGGNADPTFVRGLKEEKKILSEGRILIRPSGKPVNTVGLATKPVHTADLPSKPTHAAGESLRPANATGVASTSAPCAGSQLLTHSFLEKSVSELSDEPMSEDSSLTLDDAKDDDVEDVKNNDDNDVENNDVDDVKENCLNGRGFRMTASEMLAQLEREERRLDKAEKKQESLKRKAANIEGVVMYSPSKAHPSSK